MCIQTPGSFIWSASLAARLGSSGWSAWGVYLVTGCLQGTLLVMGSYFEIVHRRKERQLAEEEDESRRLGNSGASDPSSGGGDERTPLLHS
jgi:hypothetical protein